MNINDFYEGMRREEEMMKQTDIFEDIKEDVKN